jgi:hypothetical protein
MSAAPFRQFAPDTLFEVSTSTGTAHRQDDGNEGERRRDAALDLLRDRRAAWVRRAQRALLTAAVERGTATADDVAAAVDLPQDLDGRLLGAAPGALVHAGLLDLRGYVRSCRPQRHASILTVWGLTDAAAAVAWLRDNPDLPDSDECEQRQRTLTFYDETPTVAAAGVRSF